MVTEQYIGDIGGVETLCFGRLGQLAKGPPHNVQTTKRSKINLIVHMEQVMILKYKYLT